MYDVMAIGNALVDHEYLVSDAALEEIDLTKGNMTLAGFEEQQQLLAYFKLSEIDPSKQAGGGSAANTMYAFASLGGKPFMRAALVMTIKARFTSETCMKLALPPQISLFMMAV